MTEFQVGKITAIREERQLQTDQGTYYTQVVEVSKPGQDTPFIISVGNEYQPLTPQQRLTTGTQVILSPQTNFQGQTEYVINDLYRLPTLTWLLGGFLLASVVVAKWRGLMAMVGMAISLVVLFQFLIPQLLTGASPLWVSLVSAVTIATSTIYLSHGFNLKSHLGLISMLLTLGVVILLSNVVVSTAHLVGLGSEEAAFLQFTGTTHQLNLQGLLLAGIMLGALGILDDIVLSQISVVEQLLGANPKLKFDELYRRALSVGQDHVASLVNTLVLAYVGANLPLFLLFYLNQETPIWVTLNNELIAEEVVRTLVGSLGLVLAVPLSTFVASFFLPRYFTPNQKRAVSNHVH